ncbi:MULTISPECIES: hypothetical protein [Roseiflexus]|jgi:hypothetical protein|uniref:hypothetical protein n=1 Tax=Roseiflexus TaxID=120961 RepID=UPI000305BB33|nr:MULTISPECIES: hypothetical protein [Roseiflexus]PMP89110.1 MAG: hypothetical protein C0183_00230 [Roseiflexus castenholzii]GIW00337.1 MAG: hypothetical protein KatS3mg058_1740 [Roseiflexus sp.]
MESRVAHIISAAVAPIGNSVSAGIPPAADDKILVSRQHLEQLQRHVRLGYERFPTRHLRQSLLIIEHMLARR